MKRNIINKIALAVATVTICSCTARVEIGVENQNPEEQIEISINPQIAAITKAFSQYATKSAWTSGDKIGLYATLSIDTLCLAESDMREVDYANVLFTANSTAASTAFSSARTLYFPYSKQKLNVWGVYPYDANMKSKNAAIYQITADANQTSAEKVLEADFLVAKTANVEPTNGNVTMQFQHKMTNLILEFFLPDEIDGREVVAINSVNINNIKLEATYNFNKDLVTVKNDAETKTLQPYYRGEEVEDDVTNMMYEAIIVPQSFKSSDVFMQVVLEFRPDGSGIEGDYKLFVFKFANDVTFAQGEQHQLSLAFDTDFTIRLTGSYITDWNHVNDYTYPEVEDGI